MLAIDRTVKIMLALIVILLGILVFKPTLNVAPEALAQTRTTDDRGGGVDGYRVALISSIAYAKNRPVRDVQVLDTARSIVVRFDNSIEVYRIETVSIPAPGGK